MEKCKGCAHYNEGKCGTEKCVTFESLNKESRIKHTIGIMSGKGGVGKSSVTAALAIALNNSGFKVGILDGDIMGPSIARLFNLKGPAENVEGGLLPVKTLNGISVMSMNLLLPEENDPVLWRGPVISGIIKQFWKDVIWGDLDYLLIDFPPGTGDVALTIMQSIPLTGIIMVTSPQQLVHMIVEKGIKMTEKMKVPILGIIENMSYVQPPGYPEPYYLFGKGKTGKVAEAFKIDFLGQIPIIKEFVEAVDQGKLEDFNSAIFNNITETVTNIIKEKEGQ